MHFAFFFLLLNTRRSQFVETHYTKPIIVQIQQNHEHSLFFCLLDLNMKIFIHEIEKEKRNVHLNGSLHLLNECQSVPAVRTRCVPTPCSRFLLHVETELKSLISFVLLRNMKFNAKGKQKPTNRGNKETVISVLSSSSRYSDCCCVQDKLTDLLYKVCNAQCP